MNRFRLTPHGVCLLALLLLAGCAAGKLPSPEQPLRVGLATNYPPLAFEENGVVKGIEIDFAEQLSEESGAEVSILTMPWERLIPALRDGQIDVIMSGMSVTDERQKLVSFAEPYLRVGQMALIRAADIARLASPAALFAERWRVGFISGTTGEFFAREKLSGSALYGYKSIPHGIAALHAKQIDYFIHDAPTIWRLTSDPAFQDDELLGLFTPFTEEYLAWAVRKSDRSLREFLSATVSRWKADGRLQEILDRWIWVRVELRPPDASR